ncbi:ABC transporter ATP-binding protein [Halobacterium zhouii]|uniref:ABC transporter ATP-binding protein n=1 Tax=Halobacterium zhouii TaxID=2902624 RepID=UPI001E3B4997|nr:oligopeptide/dipeptide ABC transporter ATP-binding protein [Halobacterium zhouii]
MSTDTPNESTTDATATDAPLVELRDLKKHYDRSSGVLDDLLGAPPSVKAVDGVDLTVREGETVAVVGESGCGKSTLGRTVLNLEKPTAGTIEYRGEDITGLSDDEMRPYRRDLQMVFQDPLASLNPRQTVRDIITTPMEVHGVGDSDEERAERAKDLLERVGLKAAHVDRYPHQFSGGQQQRIAVARALTLEPDLLVADEPVSALDVSVQAQLLNLFGDLQADLGLSMLFISHDMSVVRQVADRVAVMYLGEIVEVAPVEELFDDPHHPYTKSLLSAVPRIDPDRRTERTTLEGTVPSPADPPSGCRFHTRCPAVVPPDDWTADQETFRDAFTFRCRVLDGEIDPDAVRSRLESRGQATDEDAIADYVVESALPTSLDALPEAKRDAVREAATCLASGDVTGAESAVRDAFPSPCEQETPVTTAVGAGHAAACHRVGDGRE